MRPFFSSIAVSTAVLLSACASGGARTAPSDEIASNGSGYNTNVKLQPVAAALPAKADSALPQLTVAQISDGNSGVRRIQRFDAVDQDLRTVVRALAESFGLSYRIDPAVTGMVTTSLQGVTLEEALASVVLPHGYSYQIENGVLNVGASKVQTRIFTLDYVALSRVGSSSTTIQRRLTSGGVVGANGSFNNSGSFGGGADVISSTAVADLWNEISIALNGLIFDAASATDSVSQITATGGNAATAGVNGQPALTGGASSRTASDGRRLIINPIAGTILVSASPAKLAEVATFISAFESSVQRQVLIEAKIVEVSLSKKYQFGIDWNLIASKGKFAMNLGNAVAGTGNAQFTIGSGQNQLTAILNLLQSQGNVSVLSSPRVSALNNQRANFNVTRDEVFFAVTRQPVLGPTGGTIGFTTQINPQQISVGIVLDVLPQIGPDNTITMNIRPVVTSVARIETIKLEDGSEARAPVIDRRETDTMIRVRGGETVVIGGLMQTRRDKNTSGVPVLKDIPGVGKVFTSVTDETAKDELVIFLTPTILASSPTPIQSSAP